MKAIILAAGKGSRLGEFTQRKPKCLLKLGGETILGREIRLLQEAGIKREDIYVVGGYRYELLRGEAPNLIINPEFDSKDNSYSLGLALETVDDDDVLILDADLCFDVELLEEIIRFPHDNVLLSKVSGDLEESTGIVVEDGNRVKAIGKQYSNTGFVYISIFKVGRAVIPAFRRALLCERSVKTWYPLAITEICREYEFVNKATDNRWHEIDFIEDYRETLKMFELGE